MLLLLFHLYVAYILQKQEHISIQKVIHKRLDNFSDTEEGLLQFDPCSELRWKQRGLCSRNIGKN